MMKPFIRNGQICIHLGSKFSVASFFFLLLFSSVISCNWFPYVFSAKCRLHRATDLSLFWLVRNDPIHNPVTSRCFWELHPDRDVVGMGSSIGGRRLVGWGSWNETQEAKTPNLGPGFFGRQQSVKFTEFLMLVVLLPLCLYQGSLLSDSSSERGLKAG